MSVILAFVSVSSLIFLVIFPLAAARLLLSVSRFSLRIPSYSSAELHCICRAVNSSSESIVCCRVVNSLS